MGNNIPKREHNRSNKKTIWLNKKQPQKRNTMNSKSDIDTAFGCFGCGAVFIWVGGLLASAGVGGFVIWAIIQFMQHWGVI